jgi:hypothetical protein
MRCITASEHIGVQGRLTIKVKNEVTGEIKEQIKDNLVILDGRNLIRDFLYGDPVTGLTHMAVGTDTSDPAVTPGITEVFRKVFTDKVKADVKLTVDMFLGSQEANGNILTSAAIFGNGATNVAGSGTQYNKIIYDPINKTVELSVTYTWDLLFNV